MSDDIDNDALSLVVKLVLGERDAGFLDSLVSGLTTNKAVLVRGWIQDGLIRDTDKLSKLDEAAERPLNNLAGGTEGQTLDLARDIQAVTDLHIKKIYKR